MPRRSLHVHLCITFGVVLALLSSMACTAAEPLILLVQPSAAQERGADLYRAFANHVAAATGRGVRTQIPPNFMAHWELLRRNDYDLALDASHFTDYRIRKFGFSVLAKVPDTESYGLLVRGRITDPGALAAKRIATLGMPSMAAARLHAMFPNPARQPLVVEVQTADAGMALLLSKKVDAALLPTPFVNQQSLPADITLMLTTEPIPQLALSASPRVPAELRDAIRAAVLRAHESDSGRRMLRDIGFARFEPATAEMFANQGNVLKGYWGY